VAIVLIWHSLRGAGEFPVAGQPDDPSTDEDHFGQQDAKRSSPLSSIVVIVAAVIVLALVYFFFNSDLP
jgi:hypothetical protein